MSCGVSLYNISLNSFNVSSLLCGGIATSSPFLEFISGIGFSFKMLSAILFPMISPVA